MLIVEDDVDVAERLRCVLLEQGWTVEWAATGPDATQLLANFRFDFILLDWNLPEISGAELCRRYRAQGGESPIIFVTGKHSISDKEIAFDAGGDDYITKPFDVRELLARIRAIKRRPGRLAQEELSAHGVTFDPHLHTVNRGSDSVQLSALESSIVEFLLRNKNRFFSASDIFEAVWESDAESSDETVRVRMRIIRQKLAKLDCENLIETVRGSGYIIR